MCCILNYKYLFPLREHVKDICVFINVASFQITINLIKYYYRFSENFIRHKTHINMCNMFPRLKRMGLETEIHLCLSHSYGENNICLVTRI